MDKTQKECPRCFGLGTLENGDECPKCYGEGTISTEKRLSAKKAAEMFPQGTKVRINFAGSWANKRTGVVALEPFKQSGEVYLVVTLDDAGRGPESAPIPANCLEKV